MSLSNMEIFQEEVQTNFTEVLADKVMAFNQASNGSVILVPGDNAGDFAKRAFYKKINGLVRRRNAYGSGAVAAKQLSQDSDVSVKVAAGTPPIEFTLAQFDWLRKDPIEAGVVIGEQLAQDTLADMLYTGLRSGIAAIRNNSGLIHDGSADKASLGALNSAAAKFGDRSGDIASWIMHSKPMHDIYGQALSNNERLFEFGNVRVISDGFGRPLVYIDAPELVTGGSPGTYHTLGLTQGGITIEQNNDFQDNLDTGNGDENIKRSYQAEWSYNVGVKGYKWDATSGGKSPNDAALATSTNWDQNATSVKDTAGVLLDSQ